MAKEVGSISYRTGNDILEQCFQTGFQELYHRNVFMLKSPMLNLNKFVFLTMTGPFRTFNI